MNRTILSCVSAVALALVANTADAQYSLAVEDATVAPGATFDLGVTLDSTAGTDLQGWSYGVCHDPGSITLLNTDFTTLAGPLTSTSNAGGAPDFLQGGVQADGYSLGVVISLLGTSTLPPSSGVASIAQYTNDMADGSSTSVSICDTIGTPPVASVVVVNGASITPDTTAGTITSFLPPVVSHVRGDANDDAAVNIADGIWMLNELFQGGPGGDCDSANDANDDGNYDASDAIFIFNYQFLNGPAPSAPFPDCGLAAGQVPEDCLSQSSCP